MASSPRVHACLMCCYCLATFVVQPIRANQISRWKLTDQQLDHRQQPLMKPEKSGVVLETSKSAEDTVVGVMAADFDDEANPRFARDTDRFAPYENHLSFAPYASEIFEDNSVVEGGWNPEDMVHEIHDLTTTTASTSTSATSEITSTTSTTTSTITTTTTVYTTAAAPPPPPSPPLPSIGRLNLDDFRPISVVTQQQQDSGDKSGTGSSGAVTKFTTLSPGSVYMALPHSKRECKHNFECYTMREPDEWCSTVGTHVDYVFERGCFCDHGSSFCLFERRTPNGYEYTDCFPKSQSKCEV